MPVAKKVKPLKAEAPAIMQATPYTLTQTDMHTQYGEELGAKIWAAYEKEVLQPTAKKASLYTLPKVPMTKKSKRKPKREGSASKRTLFGNAGNPITQKARGIRVIERYTPYAGTDTLRRANYKALLPYQFYTFAGHNLAPPAFARPCPVRPRHGFVESRRVETEAHLLTVFQEAVAADPNAEVMVMEQLTGSFSAVMTDSGITYGLGNDGVTAHGGKLWRIPTPEGFDSLVYDGETIKESGYMECVENWGELYAVQLRDGPRPPRALQNYIPHKDYTVTALLDATPYMNDLLAWEGVAKGLKPGTLVTAPGCALSSHVVVHCIAHKIAVATEPGFVGAIGDKLQPEASTPPALQTEDFEEMARLMGSLFDWDYIATTQNNKPGRAFKRDWPLLAQMRRGESKSKSFRTHVQSLAVTLGTLHSMSLWGNEPHLLRLRAFGAVTLCKFLIAACLGEARHFYAYGPGQNGATAAVPWTRLLEQFGISRSSMRDHRDYVYQAGLAMGHKQLGETIEQCVSDFSGLWCRMSDRNWQDYRQNGNSSQGCSYGGPNWHQSAKLTRELYAAITAFMAHPHQDTWAAVVSHYNIAINAMHNGGPLLTKWIENRTFGNATQAPMMFFAHGVAMRIICSDGLAASIHKDVLNNPSYASEEKWKHARILATFCTEYVLAQDAFKGIGSGATMNGFSVPKVFTKWRLMSSAWGNDYSVYIKRLKLWGRKSSSIEPDE